MRYLLQAGILAISLLFVQAAGAQGLLDIGSNSDKDFEEEVDHLTGIYMMGTKDHRPFLASISSSLLASTRRSRTVMMKSSAACMARHR